MTLISATPHRWSVPESLGEGVADGLAETRRYLLSHHEPAHYDRCYVVPFRGRRIRLCARCAGIYPGIGAGVVAAAYAGVGGWPLLLVVAVFPAVALVDWARTAFTGAAGTNPVRTGSGALLGIGYGMGTLEFLTSFDPRLLAIAVVYGSLAAALLTLERRSRTD